ncbi:MAG: hypothetical protein GKR89_20630 [Candidatus Latescibacteria bacterium]|nr:hypothetical protein [Candidatus Latescibacterota bacterium]
MNGAPLDHWRPHQVAADPGTHWLKDRRWAIDAPPDEAVEPLPQDQWPAAAPRSGVYGVVTPTVVPVAGGYRMYYTQILPRPGFPAGANEYDNATTRILSAFSKDGRIWSPEAGVRLGPQEGGAGQFRVVSPEVVPGPGGWRMYYECCQGAQSGGSTLRSAVSADGLQWRIEPGVRLGGEDSYNACRVVNVEDGRLRLYCGQRGRGIISAVSADGGLTFTKEAGIRIAPDGRYDSLTAFAPEVLILPGGGYRMYYAGYAAANRAYVLSALSDDGLSWRKDSEPVLAPGGPWDGAKCSEMCIVNLPGGGFCLFYEACDGSAAGERGVWRIASATSGV